MPTSLPSREIYVIDIPDVKAIDAQFVYNYFVPGEATDELAGTTSRYVNVRDDLKNSSDTMRLATRVPRWIELRFRPAKIFDPMSNITKGTPVKSLKKKPTTNNRKLIADNMSKIMSEEEFASYYFTSMDFRDSRLFDKLHEFVAGTMVYSSLMGAGYSPNTGGVNIASSHTVNGMFHGALAALPMSADSNFVSLVTDNPELRGVSLVRPQDQQKARSQKLTTDISSVVPTAQINVKYAGSMIERAIVDPLCHFDNELLQTYEDAKKTQDVARQQLKSSIISASEYKTYASPISKNVNKNITTSSKQSILPLGYLIDKIETRADGSIVTHDPIIIDNPDVGFTVDFNVKYYSIYTYVIRTLALVTMPAVMEDLNDIASAQFIIASRPTISTVDCRENVPPPPVADLNFVWDYDKENLIVQWSFPPNPQRDVKKFQIYRRENVDQPFQLLKMYDFDDSYVKAESREYVDQKLIEYMVDVPRTFYVDADFNKSSKYIYSVTCVDAHGISSGYSAQFELSFDVFKNRLVKKLISHQGAPRTYPNLYLQVDAFVDTICDGPAHDKSKNPSGPHSRLTVYFTPECYNVVRGGIKKPVVITNKDGGKYKLLMINIDNQQQQIVDMYIDNKLSEKT